MFTQELSAQGNAFRGAANTDIATSNRNQGPGRM